MIPLINFQEVKAHFRILDTTSDDDISLKVLLASSIAMDYMKRSTPAEWALGTSPETYDVPGLVQAAVFLMACDLYENREASVSDVLSKTVCNLLDLNYRDPTLA